MCVHIILVCLFVLCCLIRFLAIWFPLRFPLQITKKTAGVIIGMIWTWAGLLALPWLLFFDMTLADEGRPSLVFCVESWPGDRNGNAYFIMANLILFYFLPLAIISLCYVCIWLRVWRRQLPDDSLRSNIWPVLMAAMLQTIPSRTTSCIPIDTDHGQ